MPILLVCACKGPPLELRSGTVYRFHLQDGAYNRLQVGDVDCDGAPDLLRGGDQYYGGISIAWGAESDNIVRMWRVDQDYGDQLRQALDANHDGCDDILFGGTLYAGPFERDLKTATEGFVDAGFTAVLSGPSGIRLTKQSAEGGALDIWLPTEDGPQFHSGPYALHHTGEVRMADGDKVLPGQFWDYLGHGRVDADDEIDLIGAGGPYAWLPGDIPLVPGNYGDLTYTLPWMQLSTETYGETWLARPLVDVTGDGIVDWVYRKSTGTVTDDPDDPVVRTDEVAFYAGPLERGPDFTSPMELDWLPDEVTTAESWNHSPPTAGDFDGDGLDDLLIGGHIFKGPVKNGKIRARDAKWVLPDDEWWDQVEFDTGPLPNPSDGPFNKTQLLDVDEDGQAELVVEFEVEAIPDPQFPKIDVSDFRDTLVYILKVPER